MRKIFIGFAIVTLLATSAVALYQAFFNSSAVWTERRAELNALASVEKLLGQAPAPTDWPNRLFLPLSIVNDMASQFIGTEYRLATGERDSQGRVDGQFVVKIEAFSLAGSVGKLQPSLTVLLSYEPDRVTPEWAKARLKAELTAILIPEISNQRLVSIRLVPTRIAPELSFGTLQFGLKNLFERAIAANVFSSFADQLALPVQLPAEIKFSTKLSNSQTQSFKGGGSTVIVTDYPGTLITQPFPLDVALSTAKGVWLLGGLPTKTGEAPPADVPSSEDAQLAELERLTQSIRPKMLAWDRSDDNLHVVMSGNLLRETIEQALPPKATNRVIAIRTKNASGEIDKLGVMRDDLLGEISLVVSPDNAEFASADIAIGSSNLTWSEMGLKASVPISVAAKAQAHVHFNTAFVGGGIGTSVGINGGTSATLNLSASAAVRSTPSGRAIVFQPAIECRRVDLDVVTNVNLTIIKAGTVGVRLKKHVGGDPVRPIVLLDDVRRTIPFPNVRLPDQASVKWPSALLELQFDPKKADTNGKEIVLEAGVKAARATQPIDSTKNEADLATALLDAAPRSKCIDPEEVAVLIDGVEIGPNNEVVKWIGKAIAEGKRIGEETKKEVEKLIKTPGQAIADAPGNVIRETTKGAGNIIREGGRAIRCVFGC